MGISVYGLKPLEHCFTFAPEGCPACHKLHSSSNCASSSENALLNSSSFLERIDKVVQAARSDCKEHVVHYTLSGDLDVGTRSHGCVL
jgi:hypothetical protein